MVQVPQETIGERELSQMVTDHDDEWSSGPLPHEAIEEQEQIGSVEEQPSERGEPGGATIPFSTKEGCDRGAGHGGQGERIDTHSPGEILIPLASNGAKDVPK